jgi:hypothetical protein
MNGYQQIRIRKEDKPLLDKLCEKEGLSQVAFLKLLLKYFDETYSIKGYTDPGIIGRENNRIGEGSLKAASAVELKKLRDAVISFTRQQEKKILLPMKEMLEELTQNPGHTENTNKLKSAIKNPYQERPTSTNEKQKVQIPSIEVKKEIALSEKMGIENENLKKENTKLREHLQLIRDNITIKKMPMGKTYYVLDGDPVQINALLRPA